MSRNGLNPSLISSNGSMLGDDAIGLVAPARPVAPSQPLGLGIWRPLSAAANYVGGLSLPPKPRPSPWLRIFTRGSIPSLYY